MREVSNEYKQAIYAPIRTTKGRVTFDISDVTARGDVNDISTTTESIISNKQQLINKKREQSLNLATWEPNRFKLDGSFVFPDDAIGNNGELGFVSDNLCNENGIFELEPTLIFTFGGPHSSMGITLTFDVLNDEYATEFIINAYDSSNNLVLSEHVVDNDLVQVATIGQFYQYKKIEVIIKKWSKPYRRARVVEVDFGIVKIYTDNNLIKMDLVDEMDIITKTLPSAEFKFTADNANKDFNILNPDGFHKFLQQRQNVVPEIGVLVGTTTEYIQLGNFYLMEWTSDEGSLTATFTARNIIDLMSSFDYENLVAKSNYTLYQMAADIFNICGITNYEIDLSLQNIQTKGLVKKTNCRNVLQMIAVAGMCNVYVTRDDNLILKQLSFGSPVDIISMDNMYNEPQIELDKIVKGVEVAYYSDINTKQDVIINNADKGEVIKVDNALINTQAQATNVANWILNQRNYRAIYTANWRGNPAHELSDIVTMEDAYNQNRDAIITKIELTYQGYLEGKTEARGLILNAD
ncbi:hypothetical protein [Paratissierella segnis]|uniref:Uncharacterized protein n=1 Tax=Paratissierella segnis TaxID=2763679 RepID=A0A926ESK7_9FIRM|nr:hypothetical protein [Paratissierella segnis]MBC8588101.1 hypothetical protein [Paratissierella segnis]